MTNSPLVSVIMNCYNSDEFLKEAIDTVYAQDYPNWEIIFWDNCSTDSSPEIAQSYDERLKYFRGENNVSLGEARNLAIEKASGEFIAFLDCDDLWLPNKLSEQIPMFINDSEVGLVFSDTTVYSDGVDQYNMYDKTVFHTGKCFKELLASYWISMETVVLRTSALKSLDHLFDTRFTMIEEADLFRRLARDWKLEVVNKPLAKWRVNPNSITWTQPELYSRETELMIEKYSDIYEGFATEYSSEIALLNREIAINDAKILWSNGNGSKARKLIRPHLGTLKANAYYIFTFFPKSLIDKALMIFRKGIRT